MAEQATDDLDGDLTFGTYRPEPCPWCKTACEADWVDVGVGMVQAGPYYCRRCGGTQIGPHDAKDRALTSIEEHVGWYLPDTPPGSSANVLGGRIVGHEEMRQAYRKKWQGNPRWSEPGAVETWYEEQRRAPPRV